MHAVIAQEMRIGFDRAQIVDRDDIDILAAGFDDGAQDIAADAAKSVDCDANRHGILLEMGHEVFGRLYRAKALRAKGAKLRPWMAPVIPEADRVFVARNLASQVASGGEGADSPSPPQNSLA